jgi:protein-tyrosine phosphatase
MTHHEHKPGEPLEYNYITDGIYIGTNQCCTSGLAEVLKKENVTADISLEEIRLDQPFGVEIYIWIPTPDHNPPTQDQLSFGAESLEKLVSQKRKIYVHCKNGHGRTSTLISAYLINKGYNPKEALEIIKKGRPGAHLQDSQKEALEKYWKAKNQRKT